MPEDPLSKYVRDMRFQGFSDDVIKSQLKQAGHDDKSIDTCLGLDKPSDSNYFDFFKNRLTFIIVSIIIVVAVVVFFIMTSAKDSTEINLSNPQISQDANNHISLMSGLSYADREKLCANLLNQSDWDKFLPGDDEVILDYLLFPSKYGRWENPSISFETTSANLSAMCSAKYTIGNANINLVNYSEAQTLSIEIIESKTEDIAREKFDEFRSYYLNKSNNSQQATTQLVDTYFADLADYEGAQSFMSFTLYKDTSDKSFYYYFIGILAGKTSVTLSWRTDLRDTNTTEYQTERFKTVAKSVFDRVKKLDIAKLPEVNNSDEPLDFDGFKGVNCGELSSSFIANANATIIGPDATIKPNTTRTFTDKDIEVAKCMLNNILSCNNSRLLLFDGINFRGEDVFEADQIKNSKEVPISIIGNVSNKSNCLMEFGSTVDKFDFVVNTDTIGQNLIDNYPLQTLAELIVRAFTIEAMYNVSFANPLLSNLAVSPPDGEMWGVNSFLPEKCDFGPGIYCVDFGAELAENGNGMITLLINNGLGQTIDLININVTSCLADGGIMEGTDLSGTIAIPYKIIEGSTSKFELKGCSNLVKGTRFKSDIIITYNTTIDSAKILHIKKGYLSVQVQ